MDRISICCVIVLNIISIFGWFFIYVGGKCIYDHYKSCNLPSSAALFLGFDLHYYPDFLSLFLILRCIIKKSKLINKIH